MTIEMRRNINRTKGNSKLIHFTIAIALVLNLGLVLTPISSVGATTQNEEFTESGTFIVPETVTEITIQTWGGGGAGGGSTNTRRGARGGAGGGGGAYASSTLTVESGQELQVVVGVGGTGVSGNDGNAGSSSFVGLDTNPINALVRAAAGLGGTGNTAGGSPLGGAGGTIEASIGDIRLAGADGENGDTGIGIQSGAGGDGANEGGSGGASVTSQTSDGNPGNVPGGGGGGARTEENDGNRAGGVGAFGKVVITWVTYVIYDLTLDSTEGGSVTTPGEGIFTYGEETTVNLVAEADECHEFVKWTGDVGTIDDIFAASTNVKMSGDYFITANFMQRSYNLTAGSTDGGSVTTPGEGVFTYGQASVVGIAVEAEEGYGFAQWTGDVDTVADVYAASTTITMNGNYSITANFEEVPLVQYDLTISSTEGGSVTKPGEGIFSYDEETVVDLVATPDEGYRFVDWTGDVDTIADSDAAVTTITMKVNYSITANFVAAPSGGCFIATAAYGTPSAEQIDVLREFRDIVLLESIPGSLFVSLYYQFSPPIADFIAGNQLLKTMVREFLIDPIVWVVEAAGYIWQP
jgi:hypothetical protein